VWECVLRFLTSKPPGLACVERDDPELGISEIGAAADDDRQRWKCRAGSSLSNINLKCLSMKICTQKGSSALVCIEMCIYIYM